MCFGRWSYSGRWRLTRVVAVLNGGAQGPDFLEYVRRTEQLHHLALLTCGGEDLRGGWKS